MNQVGSLKGENIAFIAAQKRTSKIHMPGGDPVAFLQQHPMPFPLLLDESREVTRAYGVYVRFNFESINISRPASFVIVPDATIRFQYVGANQTARAPIEQLIRVLNEMRSS